MRALRRFLDEAGLLLQPSLVVVAQTQSEARGAGLPSPQSFFSREDRGFLIETQPASQRAYAELNVDALPKKSVFPSALREVWARFRTPV